MPIGGEGRCQSSGLPTPMYATEEATKEEEAIDEALDEGLPIRMGIAYTR